MYKTSNIDATPLTGHQGGVRRAPAGGPAGRRRCPAPGRAARMPWTRSSGRPAGGRPGAPSRPRREREPWTLAGTGQVERFISEFTTVTASTRRPSPVTVAPTLWELFGCGKFHKFYTMLHVTTAACVFHVPRGTLCLS